MVKTLLYLFLLVSTGLYAQDVERTKVSGKINAPIGDDLEGINIYNLSSQKGTITDTSGKFEMEVAENDRIQITSLQYQSFTVVVDKGILKVKKMNIYLNPSINQLDEVVIRPYDLSGNIKVDVNIIPTYYLNKDFDFSYYNLEYGYTFEQDAQTKISGNAAEEALHGNALTNGADVLGLLGGVASLLFPKNIKLNLIEKQDQSNALSTNLQQRFSKAFVNANFDIPEDKAVDFLFYVEENGLTKNLLKADNEMQLMQFLLKKSNEYKQRLDKN